MNNELAKKVLLGVSTLIGMIVAGGVYRTALKGLNEPELIGDVEIISEETTDDSQK